jgi:hypothetical protein
VNPTVLIQRYLPLSRIYTIAPLSITHPWLPAAVAFSAADPAQLSPPGTGLAFSGERKRSGLRWGFPGSGGRVPRGRLFAGRFALAMDPRSRASEGNSPE